MKKMKNTSDVNNSENHNTRESRVNNVARDNQGTNVSANNVARGNQGANVSANNVARGNWGANVSANNVARGNQGANISVGRDGRLNINHIPVNLVRITDENGHTVVYMVRNNTAMYNMNDVNLLLNSINNQVNIISSLLNTGMVSNNNGLQRFWGSSIANGQMGNTGAIGISNMDNINLLLNNINNQVNIISNLLNTGMNSNNNGVWQRFWGNSIPTMNTGINNQGNNVSNFWNAGMYSNNNNGLQGFRGNSIPTMNTGINNHSNSNNNRNIATTVANTQATAARVTTTARNTQATAARATATARNTQATAARATTTARNTQATAARATTTAGNTQATAARATATAGITREGIEVLLGRLLEGVSPAMTSRLFRRNNIEWGFGEQELSLIDRVFDDINPLALDGRRISNRVILGEELRPFEGGEHINLNRNLINIEDIRQLIMAIEEYGVSKFTGERNQEIITAEAYEMAREICDIRSSIIYSRGFAASFWILTRYILRTQGIFLDREYTQSNYLSGNYIKSIENYAMGLNELILAEIDEIARHEFSQIPTEFNKNAVAPVQKAFFRLALENKKLEKVEKYLREAIGDNVPNPSNFMEYEKQYVEEQEWILGGFRYLSDITRESLQSIRQVVDRIDEQLAKLVDIRASREKDIEGVRNILVDIDKKNTEKKQINERGYTGFVRKVIDKEKDKLKIEESELDKQLQRIDFRRKVLSIYKELLEKGRQNLQEQLSYINRVREDSDAASNLRIELVKLISMGKFNGNKLKKKTTKNNKEKVKDTKSQDIYDRIRISVERYGVQMTKSRVSDKNIVDRRYSKAVKIILGGTSYEFLQKACVEGKEDIIELLNNYVDGKDIKLIPRKKGNCKKAVLIKRLVKDGVNIDRESLKCEFIEKLIQDELNCLSTDIDSINTQIPYIGIRAAMENGGISAVREYFDTRVREALRRRISDDSELEEELKNLISRSEEFIKKSETKIMRKLVKDQANVLKGENRFRAFCEEFYKQLQDSRNDIKRFPSLKKFYKNRSNELSDVEFIREDIVRIKDNIKAELFKRHENLDKSIDGLNEECERLISVMEDMMKDSESVDNMLHIIDPRDLPSTSNAPVSVDSRDIASSSTHDIEEEILELSDEEMSCDEMDEETVSNTNTRKRKKGKEPIGEVKTKKRSRKGKEK